MLKGETKNVNETNFVKQRMQKRYSSLPPYDLERSLQRFMWLTLDVVRSSAADLAVP